MTNRFCHAVLCLALLLIVPASIQAEPNESSHRNTERTRIVNEAVRSSVNIHTEKRQKSIDVVFSAGKGTKINGMGTGIVIDDRGYIVTNYHVVQDVEKLRVTTFEGQEYDARVLAYDSREDLAVIKVQPRTPLSVARFGTSSDLMLGEDVIAIGNAYGYESTVTRGIISHRSRDVEVTEQQSYDDLIQIDAAINPGNSGGPLLNADGEVIGINVAIRAGAQRIGFAIPIDKARTTIARLMNIELHQHTYHGIVTRDEKQGTDRKLVVEALKSDSPARTAGLQTGDVILKSGGVDIVDAADLERSLFGKAVHSHVPLVVLRDGERVNLDLTLVELSASHQQPGRQTLAANTVSASKIASPPDKCWSILGLKLETTADSLPIPEKTYRGGMRVVEVRGESLAARNGIHEGDVLVGLHIWETVSEENIDYVLNLPQLRTMEPLKFYIVRDGVTLWGYFRFNEE